MKKLYLAGAVVVAALFMSGCNTNSHEVIVTYGRSVIGYDNINISLKEGYWVKDYTIDYDNMTITFRLEED